MTRHLPDALSLGQLPAQCSPAVPTRVHQAGGEPTRLVPARGRLLAQERRHPTQGKPPSSRHPGVKVVRPRFAPGAPPRPWDPVSCSAPVIAPNPWFGASREPFKEDPRTRLTNRSTSVGASGATARLLVLLQGFDFPGQGTGVGSGSAAGTTLSTPSWQRSRGCTGSTSSAFLMWSEDCGVTWREDWSTGHSRRFSRGCCTRWNA